MRSFDRFWILSGSENRLVSIDFDSFFDSFIAGSENRLVSIDFGVVPRLVPLLYFRLQGRPPLYADYRKESYSP